MSFWEWVWIMIQTAMVLWIGGGWTLSALDDCTDHGGASFSDRFSQYSFMLGAFVTLTALAWIWS